MGLFTKRQLLGIVIAAVIVLLLILVLPFQFMTKFLIALIPAVPILIIAYYPENQMSPLVYVRFFAKRIFFGKDIRIHDGNSTYYKKRKPRKEVKITRHKEYQGIR